MKEIHALLDVHQNVFVALPKQEVKTLYAMKQEELISGREQKADIAAVSLR